MGFNNTGSKPPLCSVLAAPPRAAPGSPARAGDDRLADSPRGGSSKHTAKTNRHLRFRGPAPEQPYAQASKADFSGYLAFSSTPCGWDGKSGTASMGRSACV